MSDTVLEILKRTPIVLIILGALLLIIGTSGNISISNVNLLLPDLVSRLIVGTFGGVLLIFGSFVAWRESPQNITRETEKFGLIASSDTSKQSFRLQN